jgi:hypothetical protein
VALCEYFRRSQVNQLLFLIAAALMVGAAIYLGHQGFRLRQANRLLFGVVKNMNETKPFALTEPQQALAEAVRVIWLMAEDGWLFYGEEGMTEAQRAVCDFTLKYPKPQSETGEKP